MRGLLLENINLASAMKIADTWGVTEREALPLFRYTIVRAILWPRVYSQSGGKSGGTVENNRG